MHVGLGEMKLSSDQFWNLTPREIFAALTPLSVTHAAPLRRHDLARLMAAFPDTKERTNGSTTGHVDRRG